MSQIEKEDETNKLLTQLLTKHDDSLENQSKLLKDQSELLKQNSEAINLLKEGQTKILESFDTLSKAVSEHTSENPVGPSPGIPGDKGNAGKKEDAPNALAPDEKDPASGSDSPGSDTAGLSGETKKTDKEDKDVEKDEDKEEKKMEKDDDKDEEKKMEKDEEKGYPVKEEKKMKKGETLPGSYRSSIDKADNPESKVTSSILKSMQGEGFKAQTVTPQMVKSKIIADITKHYIENKGANDQLKNIPVGGQS